MGLYVKTTIRGILTAVVAAALLFSSVQVASASPSDTETSTKQDALAAIQEIKDTGQLSDAGREALLAVPELAAQVLDPGVYTVEETLGPITPSSVSPMAGGCATQSFSVSGKTVVGLTAYTFHHSANLCWNGSSITSITNRQSWVTNVTTFMFYRGLVSNTFTGVGQVTGETFAQGHMENCVGSQGCIQSDYPWVRINASGIWGWNGGFTGIG